MPAPGTWVNAHTPELPAAGCILPAGIITASPTDGQGLSGCPLAAATAGAFDPERPLAPPGRGGSLAGAGGPSAVMLRCLRVSPGGGKLAVGDDRGNLRVGGGRGRKMHQRFLQRQLNCEQLQQ